MFAFDWMLFGATLATGGAAWCLSIPAALLLAIPSAALQHYSYGDRWGAAIAKGALVGMVTAIPTALPSAFTFAGGVLGLATNQPQKKVKGNARPARRIVVRNNVSNKEIRE